ncbi:MAG: hypothetical protein AB1659_01935 [Thermodesulfobacteriota bacterium]
MKNFKIRIEHQCPQCGAPITLEETDRLFACPFCRVTSYLSVQDYFRYVLPFQTHETNDLFFFPYWRFKGMLFSQVEDGIRENVVDMSHQATAISFIPPSLGFRSQALKLRFAVPEADGFFIRPQKSIETVRKTATDFIGIPLPKPVFHQTHIGESLSLIYSPFYIKNRRLFDAVLNKPFASRIPEDFNPRDFPGGSPESGIRFIATLCPDCGWDMSGARDSLVLICKNCETFWMPVKNEFTKLKAAYLPGENKNEIYLPFWRIRADIRGIELDSYADLVRIANLPKVVKKNDDQIPFFFWCPAFKIRPDLFLRLCSQLTLSQPGRDLADFRPGEIVSSVTLAVSEAIESLKLNLTTWVKPRREFLENLSKISVLPKAALLVYLPFETDRHDFKLSEFGITVNRNALGLAANL